ncbi:ferrichrome-iron receptor [Flavobacterium cauense R2A-7]|uniref:Iron complex outermembrane receptor protein n=1 Tax=Flavobacterium cauense R2A-7 TaxID=1341154 RepID=V6S2J3_9FLAO|nr:TonB-dependent receptor [Flavobacterium cauense]ESU20619.1 ferrichrome-iron receptor [Flavobacterium cauense R2A-7]KGO83000.1 TonB-dependent receptor [Flavobacterium cauense R2A-7]TWI10718.1 iron complex outermembrane receptor protein [Flavobacterium cauense R2A-7]
MKAPVKFLFAVLFFTFHINAQTNGSVKGSVVSSQNLPLEKVTVTAQNAHFSTLTDDKGNFSISNVTPGKYTLIFSHIGFTVSSIPVIVKSNSVTVVPKISLTSATSTLSEVIVSGSVINRNLANGKAGIRTVDLPQSVQVIDAKVLEQQQTIRLSDVIKNVNGVYVGSARGGAQESFWSRGYDMTANNMFKNGFRFNGGSMPEVASLEQVEALKGSSALLFGNVAPGGIVNMVTKTPLFAKGGSVSFQTGSYAYFKPIVDFYGPLSKNIAYRFVGSYENAESFRDVVTRERFYVNPSLLFKATKKTSILLQGDYLRDYWTPDFGTGVIGKKLVDLPRNTYLGAKWSNGLTTQASFSGQVVHKINSNLKFSSNTSLQDYARKSEGTERIQPDANGDFKRPLGKNNNTELITAEQLNLQGTFTTGSIKHQLSTGLDSDYSFAQAFTYVFDRTNYDLTPGGLVNIYNPTSYENEYEVPGSRNSKIVRTETFRFGAYAQDLISLTSKFKVLAGIRWSWQEAQAKNYNEVFAAGAQTQAPENDPNPKKDAKRVDAAFSPKAGLVYQPTKSTSLFASYANSFTPNTGTDIYGKNLAPSIIDQFEVGAKKEFLNGKLTTNVTLYQIVNGNFAQMAPFLADGTPNNTDTTKKMLSGQTTSKGVEIDVNAKPIDGLSILVGYSYNDMRFTKVLGEWIPGSFVKGDRVARTPQHTANASFFYTVQSGFFKGFSVGSIANYIGDRIGGWNNDYVYNTTTNVVEFRDREIPVDGYITVDASVGYTWKQISLLCKVSNITNELNYSVHENYSINPIAPRQVMATLKYKF